MYIGSCHPNQDLDLNPLLINLPAIREQAICSPEETRTSYSFSEKFSLISLDFLTNSFVTPLIADETTITLYFFFLNSPIIRETFLIFSIVPTDVPPNLSTTIFVFEYYDTTPRRDHPEVQYDLKTT